MDSKKIVADFIRPRWQIVVILLLVPFLNFFILVGFLCGTLPALIRANKNLKKIEASGDIEAAAKELISSESKKMIKGRLVFTNNYVFCKHSGHMFTYDEILWAYKHRQTTRFLLIPIKVNDSLYLASKTLKPTAVVTMGKDKKEDLKDAILEIYRHNNSCLVGYTNETLAKYKALTSKY